MMASHPEIEVILSDLDMPDMDGFELLAQTVRHCPTARTVVMSAHGELANIRRAMNVGAFDFLMKPLDFPDLQHTLAKTADFVRELRRSLEGQKENQVLKMFVADSVMDYMHLGADGQTHARNQFVHRTVMFQDICSFTRLTERTPPATVLRLLNRYFDVIVGCILEHRGQVDKFIGDAVMATFDGPGRVERCAQAALHARRAIREQRV